MDTILGEINDPDSPTSLTVIQNELFQLTKEADLETLSIQTPIAHENLIDSIQKFESIKELLVNGDKAELILTDGTRVPIKQSVTVDIEKLREEATREILVQDDHVIILVVRKPDYLADSQWQLRHNDKNFVAIIEDKEWLSKFQHRKLDVRPGDALRCKVRVETAHSHSNNVISQKHCITQVLGGVENPGKDDLSGLFTPF